MKSAKRIPTALADRYAKALYGLATEQKALSGIRPQVVQFIALLEAQPELLNALSSQQIKRDEKSGVLEQVFAKIKVSELFANFCQVVVGNKRAGALPRILQRFLALDDAAQGIIPADVTVARTLSGSQEKELAHALEERTGKKVKMTVTVDDELLAGLKVRMGSILYDASLRSSLEGLHTLLKKPQDA